MTDIVSGWTENRATWNKGAAGVLEQIKSIEQALPFQLRGFDCDNGRVFKNLCQVKARARNSTENTAKETNALRLLSAKNESRTCLAAEPQSILSRADNTKKNNKVLMPW